MRQNRLRGALYLENSLTTHAFTPDRVALLELVAAQAAISLENTHLYSELEERESRIRRLVDSNVIGIFFWDLSGSISEANDACLALIGYSREDLKAGAIDWKNITPPEYWAGDERATEELHETGSCTPYEKEYIRKDGRRTRVLIGATFLSRSRHEGVAFVVDLAERQRAEVEREARRVAEAANIAKTRFLAHMSHELRTPLNGILGYAQLLQRDPSLDAGQLARVDTIAHSGEHLLALINDLLDVAKIEAGKLELLTAETMLPDLLRTIVEIAEVQANQRGLTFVFEVTPDIPAAVLVDERRLRQVLLNLLANAIRFTDAGRVVLRVARTGAERVRFEVQDTGVGIPIERQDSVFQPFGPDGERTRSRGGTGLGLAISGEIVRRMGGDIRLESRPGKGSRFWFELDLQPAQTSAPLQEQHVPVRYAGEPRKVLVVDDVMVNRALLVEGLSSVGLQVFAAASGLECLAMAESLRPDLIVMDLVMPGIGGLETIRRLRNTGRFENVPIIATSANASPQDAKDSAAAGANAFFPKPTQLVELLREIGALLQLSWVNDVHPESRADGAPLVAPPAPEMDVLYRLACEGDMKAISHAAARVAEIDEHYSAFSDRLRALASSYQTKAVLAFVEQFRNETK
jgi:PAS domain S-box-containing protein